jgi:hypothetical protein
VGPQDPKDVVRDTARDLSALVGELAALKADATHWLTSAEYSCPPAQAGGRARGGRGGTGGGSQAGEAEREAGRVNTSSR